MRLRAIEIAPRYQFLYDVGRFILLSSILLYLVLFSAGKLNYNWQWYRLTPYLYSWDAQGFQPGPLLNGLVVTLWISAVSLVISCVLGLVTALLRLSKSFTARWIARMYLELIRNTPLLVQLFFIYFVIAPVLDIGRIPAAIMALSLFEGAYASEIFRAGILSIERGQWEAAESLGLNRGLTYRLVVLPQAIKRMLPPLTSQAVSLIKDSALVSTIAIYDLTMKAQEIISETYLVFELWFVVAAIYLTITATLSIFIALMEKRLATQ